MTVGFTEPADTVDGQLRAFCDLLLLDLQAKLRAEGIAYTGLGLSLFLVNDANDNTAAAVESVTTFSGDMNAIGMFAPEWAFALTRSLLDDGPTEVFERVPN